ncbi:MAG: ferritin-like domain-containing protein [Acidimicrobiales bacterium]
MAFDFETYQRGVRAVDLDGVDFDAFRDQPLAPDDLRCIRYMHDVEHHTACYLRNLLNTKAHSDPEITAFLTLWGFEEYWHGYALAQVLAAHGEPAGQARVAAMRQRLGWQVTVSPIGWMIFSSLTRHFLAVHMTFGVINEWTTQAGYGRLSSRAGHPVLSELLRRIMRQEGRHIDYYLTQARARLVASASARRTTRAAIHRVWRPVGSTAMPGPETRHLVRTLFGGDEGRSMIERIDRRIDGLPGLAGLQPVSRALGAYGIAS